MPPGDEAFDLPGCLRQVRAGDQQAARRLVEHMYPLVARTVRAYLPRNLHAEDWEQEVFLRMFARLEQYRADAPFEHWLARIAVNVCLDQLRQQRRRFVLRWSELSEPEQAMLQEALATPDSHPDVLAARDLVDRLLSELEAEDQLLLRMLDLEKRSVADVARLLSRSESWVKVRAFRIRHKLREVLNRLLEASLDA